MPARKKQRVILVHGFNVSDKGAGTTGQIAALFRKVSKHYEIIEFSPGWRFLLGVRFRNWKLAQELAEMIRPGDWLIGHSDGCNLIDMAAHSVIHKAPLQCVYMNPALDAYAELARNVSKCMVFHTDSDKIVWISKFLTKHKWGQMGKVGYYPASPEKLDLRYRNISYESLGFEDLGHSGVYKTPKALQRCLVEIENHLTHIYESA